jgi:P-type Ca2+ transporter type 2C
VLYVPFIRQHFRFSMLHVSDLLIRLNAGVLSVLWFEALKIVTRSRLMHA